MPYNPPPLRSELIANLALLREEPNDDADRHLCPEALGGHLTLGCKNVFQFLCGFCFFVFCFFVFLLFGIMVRIQIRVPMKSSSSSSVTVGSSLPSQSLSQGLSSFGGPTLTAGLWVTIYS